MAALGSNATRVMRHGMPSNLRLLPLALFFALAFGAACTPVQPAASASAPAPALRASPDAGPGANPISAARARAVFSALCIATRGARSGVEAAAAADGFVRNVTFGTYYHPQDNLSVKLLEGDCSMVFASRAPEGELRAALTSLNAGNPPIVWRGQRLGLFNVRVAAR